MIYLDMVNSQGGYLKMRVSYHNGRADKNGRVYSSKHNDRNFDISKAPHIDNSSRSRNVTWNYYRSNATFEQVEQRFYEEHFSRALENQNQRYRANRQHGRVKTMNDYLKGKQTCPEEVIIQIGNLKNGNASPEVLQKIFEKQLQWETEKFKNVVTLDWALHTDEATPHIHQRKVWIAEDKDGNQIVSQNKALKAMGIERPDTSKVTSKFNNEKQTYTDMCRQHFQELCLQHGLEIETEPIAQSQKSLSITEYKAKQSKQKLDNLTQELVFAKSDINDIAYDNRRLQDELIETQNKLARAKDDVNFINELKRFENDIKIAPVKDEKIHGVKTDYTDKDGKVHSGYFIPDWQMNEVFRLKEMSNNLKMLVAKLDGLFTAISKSLSYLLAKERGIDERKLNRKEFNLKIERDIKPQIMQIANSLEVDTHKPKLKRIIDDYER